MHPRLSPARGHALRTRLGGWRYKARRYGQGQPEEHASMTYRLRPDDEAAPQRRDTSHRLRVIERWLPHAEEELLYTPDASEEATATPLDVRYYLRWGAGSIGVLAILRFPVDARHPVTQTPYGAY